MATFTVNEGREVNAGEGRVFKAGDEIELTAEAGVALVENGTVSPKVTPKSAPQAPKGYDKDR